MPHAISDYGFGKLTEAHTEKRLWKMSMQNLQKRKPTSK